MIVLVESRIFFVEMEKFYVCVFVCEGKKSISLECQNVIWTHMSLIIGSSFNELFPVLIPIIKF